ncbi:MAG: CPBP family intramembrane glutamic endopeptidase [Acidimicrobiia bacterium]
MAEPAPTTGWRDWVVPAAFVVGLAAWCVGRSLWLDGRWHPWANTVAGLLILALGFAAGLDRADLGLLRKDAWRGLGYGAALWAIVAAVLVIGALLPMTRDSFQDDATIVSTGAMLRRTLIVIPFGTALLEEVAFRGVLLGLFAKRTSIWRAAIISSVLFGLWHIPPTIHSTSGSGAIADASKSGGSALAVLGVVVAMTAAGMVFCWVRIRSKSLVAPFVAHWWINATAFAVAWAVSR